MQICVIIPTYNESRKIGKIVEQIRKQNWQIVVIDDGSTDNTAEISRSFGATVLKNEKNFGKGFSLSRGLEYARDRNFDAVVTIDGDGQHLPAEIPQFIKLAKASDAGLIVGNRMHNPHSMPLIRVLTNMFMSWLISKLIRRNIPDTQCGFRLMKSDLVKEIRFNTQRFEIDSEILIQAARLGYKIESIPIKSIYHKERSQINPLLDTLRFINYIWRHIWTLRS